MPHPFGNTGYKLLPPDPRNFVYEKAFPIVSYPPEYKSDLSALGVYNQEQIPDCVENAITLAHRYYLNKNGTLLNLCRRFLAILTVKDDGFSISAGTNVQNALKRAKNTGVCETTYLADDHSLDEVSFSALSFITQDALNNAATHKLTNYAFVTDVSEQGLKSAIYQHGVVVVGLKLDKNWWTAPNGAISWAAQDLFTNKSCLRLPTDAASISGHAVVLYGYEPGRFIGQNSFSTEWGDNGMFYLGLDYLPFIYEIATLVDLTPQQLQAVQIVDTIDQLQKVETPQSRSVIEQIISSLWAMFLTLFK